MTQTIGISDIGLYLPGNAIGVQYLADMRSQEQPQLAVHLSRALSTTGQVSLRFPRRWEDTATMAAEAAHAVLLANPSVDLRRLRHLVVGTETTLDHAKPLSAYVQGMLLQAGLPLPRSLSSFQVQHACAGGTLGLLAVAAMLRQGGRAGECGLVLCSDIARYEPRSTAEITQGAGAAALLVEAGPRLLELELDSIGLWSNDVDDFFRPLGRPTARVRGSYSLKCYEESLEGALLDYCRRLGSDPRTVLEGTDMIVLHTPFHNLPELMMRGLLGRVLGLGAQEARQFLHGKGLYASVAPVARVGNTYTASLYLCLAALLEDRLRLEGDRVVGRSVLMASYGSGNTMVMVRGRVAPGATEVIRRWSIERLVHCPREAGWEEYLRWAEGPGHQNGGEGAGSPGSRSGCHFLRRVRADGYREYGYQAPQRPAGEQTKPAEETERATPASPAPGQTAVS
jgi:hydroxymethylglutaryl-CoA synthase